MSPPSEPIARSEAAQEFGRQFMRNVERMAADRWVRSIDVYRRTIDELPNNAYVRHIQEKSARAMTVTAVIERIREAEFPHLEREKRGSYSAAPVFYRVSSR